KPVEGSYLETLWAAIIPGNTAFTFGDTESYLKKEAQAWWIGSESGPMNNWAWLLNLYKDSYLSWLYHSLKDFGTLQEVLYETDDIKPKNSSALGDVKFFRDIGTAVFKSGWGKDDFVFVFRSGPFYNHQHMDQGSFYFADFGKIFLEERYDGEHHYYDDPVYKSHAIQPISHNTILIDRNPQSQKVGDPAGFAEGMKDQASLSRWLDSEAFAFASGNLEGVYRERVKKLRRNVLHIKPRSILLVDEIVPDKENVEVNLLFHPEWKKDINIEQEYTTFTKGKAALYLYHLLPQCLEREILQEPHFLCQYKGQPLVERGYLQLSSRTRNKKLIFANFMSSTREGEPPPLKISTADDLAVIDSFIEGIHNTILVNAGKLIDHKGLSTDALILAENDRSIIFAAGATFIKKDSEILFRSEYPIVANLHISDREMTLTYHLSKSSKILLKVDSKPRKLDLNGKIVRDYSFDSNNSTITLNIPSGEGKVRVI
ncbi:heparinase II/III family protein, partial [bacterium]|nr:heparinase II/III family protein [bacterium]